MRGALILLGIFVAGALTANALAPMLGNETAGQVSLILIVTAVVVWMRRLR